MEEKIPVQAPTEAPEMPPVTYGTAPAPVPELPKQENVLAGVVGAFLLSLVAAALYLVIYQLGYIAGICGLVAVILANFGYKKFSGVDHSIKGVVIAIVMAAIAIFLGEYFALTLDVYNVFNEEGVTITFFEAMRILPEFFSDSEVTGAVVKDLLIAYALGAFASFSTIRQTIAANKAAKQ